ncbi:MAG: homoserine dehydrogenase [Eubacteriales bacterium]|nr:homoserine dehydrogenase [Eubacteriales bacterium]
MKIGILGYGTVGKAVYELLSDNSELEVKYILRKKGKAVGDKMTDDINKIICDYEIQLIIDALPGIHPSYEYIKEAITHGKNVVSANKAALAYDFDRLLKLACKNKVALLYEASCGGAIPIIDEAKKISKTDKASSICGILNGTSNYILYKMYKDGLDFETALNKAKELGYAEADPTADIEGFDVRNKAVILCSTVWNTFSCKAIETLGISSISHEKILSFANENRSIKLMMMAKKLGNHYKAYVMPVIIDNSRLEANVPDNYNIATIEAENAGRLTFFGQGAGGRATASAVIRDAYDILECLDKGNSPESLNTILFNELIEDNELIKGKVYLDNNVYEHASPHDYLEVAAKNNSFFAFLPDYF